MSVCLFVCVCIARVSSRNFQDTDVWFSIHYSKCQRPGISAFQKVELAKPGVENSRQRNILLVCMLNVTNQCRKQYQISQFTILMSVRALFKRGTKWPKVAVLGYTKILAKCDIAKKEEKTF